MMKRLRFPSLGCIIQKIEKGLFKGVQVETNVVPVNVRNPGTGFDFIYTAQNRFELETLKSTFYF